MNQCTCKECRQRDRILAKIRRRPAAMISEKTVARLRDPRRNGHTLEAR